MKRKKRWEKVEKMYGENAKDVALMLALLNDSLNLNSYGFLTERERLAICSNLVLPLIVKTHLDE